MPEAMKPRLTATASAATLSALLPKHRKTMTLSGDLAKKYPKGVKLTKEGFPDFGPYAEKTVSVPGLKGNYTSDFTAANRAAGYRNTPSGYSWHHVEDGKRMMLVPRDLHEAVRHTGGAAFLR